jgi:hypothetical protein
LLCLGREKYPTIDTTGLVLGKISKINIHIYLFWYFGAQIAARAAIFENEQIQQTHTSTTHQTTALLQLEHHKTHKLMHTNLIYQCILI